MDKYRSTQGGVLTKTGQAIKGFMQEADNSAAGTAAGVGATAFFSFTGPAAPAIGLAASEIAEEEYAKSNANRSWDDFWERVLPAPSAAYRDHSWVSESVTGGYLTQKNQPNQGNLAAGQ